MSTILRANGTFTPGGFNEPTATGAVPIGDDDDATYLDFPQGAGNATVGIEVATGTPPSRLDLHLRMTVLLDDPTGFVGTGEVFLNTAADGDSSTEFAGFSDGAVSGFGFNVPTAALSGTVDLAVPLNLTPWAPTSFADVTAALAAGAYFDFNAWTWEEGVSEPTFRVFEAWLEYLPAGIPPRRFIARGDDLAGGAGRFAPRPKSVQRGSRFYGAVI